MAKKMNEKAKVVIKCFLVLNKGKWFTASEIAEFLSKHNFGLGQYYISAYSIGSIIYKDNGIFNDIEIEKLYTTKRYRYNG